MNYINYIRKYFKNNVKEKIGRGKNIVIVIIIIVILISILIASIIIYMQNMENSDVAVLDEIIKYFKKEGFEILPIKQSDEERNYWNGKLFS